MVEIIYDDRMSLRHSAIGHFIVNKGAVIFPGHLPGFFFQSLEIAAVVFVIDFIIKRHKVRTFFCDIIHNRLLKTASQVQVFQQNRSHWSFTRSKIASKSVMPGKTGATKQTVRMPAS